jgi:hypothetical protein
MCFETSNTKNYPGLWEINLTSPNDTWYQDIWKNMNLACVFVDVKMCLCFAPQFGISFIITFNFTSILSLALCEICCGLQREIVVE